MKRFAKCQNQQSTVALEEAPELGPWGRGPSRSWAGRVPGGGVETQLGFLAAHTTRKEGEAWGAGARGLERDLGGRTAEGS
jgi:hypothetical protein